MSWQCLHSHAPHTCTEGSGIWHKVPFQMGTGLRLLSSSLFKLRETCQNLSRGEEQIVIGENKWGKPEALDRAGGAGREEHPVSISFKGQRYIPICLLLLSYFSLCYFSPLLFPASSSDSFEITIAMDI